RERHDAVVCGDVNTIGLALRAASEGLLDRMVERDQVQHGCADDQVVVYSAAARHTFRGIDRVLGVAQRLDLAGEAHDAVVYGRMHGRPVSTDASLERVADP